MNTQEDNSDPTNCPAETVYNLFKPLQPIMKRCPREAFDLWIGIFGWAELTPVRIAGDEAECRNS